jgi:hypothetical protein
MDPFMSATFSYPWLLAPFAALALLVIAMSIFAQLRPGLSVRVVGQRPIGQGLGMALILLGLGLGVAEPRWGLPETPRLTVHVVLDASKSMRVEDVNGKSRWNAAVSQLDRLWATPQPGLSWGLHLLTGDAIPILPPGEDRTLLRESLRAAQPGDIGSPGSSFGRGLPQIISEIDPKSPAVLLLMSDGEETWETENDAQQRVVPALQKAKLPLYALSFGGTEPKSVPQDSDKPSSKEPAKSAARPEFMKALAEGSGGRMLSSDVELRGFFAELASGRAPLPARRSLQPSHPELGAWIALVGLALWLLFAGKPLNRWRPVLMLLFAFSPSQLSAQPLPQGVKAWLAQRALERNDLSSARKWKPSTAKPDHALLAAQIELKSGFPDQALMALSPLLGQGVQRPLPAWRAPALLLAARAQLELKKPEEAQSLLERLLLEQPGQKEAIHDLQSLVKDPTPPPPPNPKNPPPPPPLRPSQGAQQDELEGRQQRMPKPPANPSGVKDQ